MLFEKVMELLKPILENQAVMRARKGNMHFTNGATLLTGFTIGSNIQLCIYDKMKELLQGCDETKMSLIFNDCLNGEIPDDLTRVEFRLRREALKYLEINTVQDLLEKETALVDYLTDDWFRILDSEKKSKHGHEKRQQIHPLWQQVRDLFFEYFPGAGKERKPIERNGNRREIKCTGEALVKQVEGCLSTVAALTKGVFESEEDVLPFVTKLFSEPARAKKVFQRTRERTIELGIVRGVQAPDAIDWHLEPRYACESIDGGGHSEKALQDFRAEFDEDLQYERVRNFAVAGRPF